MGLLKQLMIFGKTGLQGLPTRVALFLWAFSRQGATGVPLFTTWDSVADPGIILSVLVMQLVGRLGGDGFWDKDYGWGVRVRRPFGARGRSSVRYGARLGDLERIGFFCFPIKHSNTHGVSFREKVNLSS